MSAAAMRRIPPGDEVRSPCISVCEMDSRSGYCRGCLRTLDEIASWSVLDAEQKKAVLALLPSRRVEPADPSR